MHYVEKTLSNRLIEQFPAFYKEEGRTFMEFVKQYYQFLEQSGNNTNRSRNLFEYNDIDQTLDQFLDNYAYKYMSSIPSRVLGDRRLLQKHILDLYRSKGSVEGIRLLFRLLYNEEIDVYVPSVDMLRASNGKWIERQYIEVEDNISNSLYTGKKITGTSTGATALVEHYETRKANGRIAHILFISNLADMFEPGELLLADDVGSEQATKVLGSVRSLSINEGNIDQTIGDAFVNTNGGLKVLTNEIAERAGIIVFNLEDGGSGYTINPDISITTGSNTSGSGADFEVAEITDTFLYVGEDTPVLPYLNVALSAASFYSPSANDSSNMANSNISTVIADALDFYTTTVGTISKLRVLNPGTNYNGSVSVTINEPSVARAGIPDGSGGILGNNAVVTTIASFGTGVVSSVRVIDSGLNYNNSDDILTLTKDDGSTITATFDLQGVGIEEGFWRGTEGFINSDKYIQDSFFYQEFSYQIKSSRSLDKYIKVLRNVVHPAGNEVFSRAVIEKEIDDGVVISDQLIKRIPQVWNDGDTWYDTETWTDYENEVL